MKDLLLNPITGDLALTLKDTDLVIVDGVDEIVQQLKIRFRFFLGECLFDPSKGINYFGQVFVANPNLGVITNLFKKVIIGTGGVNNLLSFSISYDKKKRVLSTSFSVNTLYGVVSYSGGLETVGSSVFLIGSPGSTSSSSGWSFTGLTGTRTFVEGF